MSDDFTTIRTVGGLLPPDLLRRLANGDQELGFLTPASYGLAPTDRLGEAAARAWAKAKAYWAAFQAATQELRWGGIPASAGIHRRESGITPTREQWLLPLLRDLGYDDIDYRAAAEELGGRRFPISHHSGPLPLHLVGLQQGLDDPAPAAGSAPSAAVDPPAPLPSVVAAPRSPRSLPPHALLQEYLNLSAATYGLVSNGKMLRLLRDTASLTRQAYVEFDLEAMFNGGVYADYLLLYLVLHRSRLPLSLPLSGQGTHGDIPPALPASGGGATTGGRGAVAPLAGESCILEIWRTKAEAQGTRALGALRAGVEEAIQTLGTGFLVHPANDALRRTLSQGTLTTPDLYAQVLRLVYRLIFLFAAEERDLLFPAGAEAGKKGIYQRHYAASTLRELAGRHRTDDRHDDLWRGFRVTCRLVADGSPDLGLPALGGGLFDAEACPDLDTAQLGNAPFATAIVHLSSVRLKGGGAHRVNYRDMDAEELGGVYEGLLERQPRVTLAVGTPRFELVGSGQRKQTGSYYTPTALVQELITSALEPVIAERLAAPKEGPQGTWSLGAPQSRQAERLAGSQADHHPATPGTRLGARAALLGITVCDPACGSGHFLLAAARRLARYLARIDAGDAEPSLGQMRAALREVIRRCLYGVDMNPLAVDLCKLALWLEGQMPGLPLTFLDQHIKLGNSLVGATPELVADGLPDDAFAPVSGDGKAHASGLAKLNRRERHGQTSTNSVAWERAEVELARESERIADLPEREVRQVAEQRSAYRAFDRGPRETARASLDAWTAAFFWPLRPEEPEPPMSGVLRAADPGQRPSLATAQEATVRRLREQHRFFHWPIEFPEVFGRGGFDCVLGNPPWERIKLQEQEFFAERDDAIATAPNKAARERLIDALRESNPALHRAFEASKRAAEGQSKFARGSGRFPLSAIGDVNLYPLFAEHDWRLLDRGGRAGVIVPTGIATDDSTKRFFGAVVEDGALASLFDFENRKPYFEAVDSRTKFSRLTLTGSPAPASDMAFMLTDIGQLADGQRRFHLSRDDFALLNPNTRTCPIFRTTVDAELTRAIYRRVPVLIDEQTGANPWGVSFMQGLFNMTSDSNLFWREPGPGRVPLYEAKLFHQFSHRWATYTGRERTRTVSDAELANPSFAVTPRYWVDRQEVEARLEGKIPGLRPGTHRPWLLAFRDIARNTDERTAIFSVLPRVGVGHNAPLALVDEAKIPGLRPWVPAIAGIHLTLTFAGCLNSLVFDYTVRTKVGGTHLTFFIVNQLPVLPPTAYTPADLAFITPRVLELVYTAYDLAPFARDMGYDGLPFAWDPDRRAVLRAELDAYYAGLYGLTRDELRYVLDPSDVYGPDFPSVTFPGLKNNDIKQYGEYRTQRLVLEAWDRLGVQPRNR